MGPPNLSCYVAMPKPLSTLISDPPTHTISELRFHQFITLCPHHTPLISDQLFISYVHHDHQQTGPPNLSTQHFTAHLDSQHTPLCLHHNHTKLCTMTFRPTNISSHPNHLPPSIPPIHTTYLNFCPHLIQTTYHHSPYPHPHHVLVAESDWLPQITIQMKITHSQEPCSPSCST